MKKKKLRDVSGGMLACEWKNFFWEDYLRKTKARFRDKVIFFLEFERMMYMEGTWKRSRWSRSIVWGEHSFFNNLLNT